MSKRTWRVPLLVLVITSLLVAACFKVAQEDTPTTTAQQDGTTVSRDAIVEVRNENDNYMRVYVSENGNNPWRLNSVESMSNATWKLRVHPGSRYLFVLMPLGSRDAYATESIDADGGDTIYLSIANHLPFTTVTRGVGQ